MKKQITVLTETESLPVADEPRNISFKTQGTLFTKDGLCYISYKENPDEFGNTTTTIKLSAERIDIIRTGDISSRLIFSKIRPFESSYTTPYGNLPLKIETHSIKISTGENSGSIFMEYTLCLAGETTENKFTLKYF